MNTAFQQVLHQAFLRLPAWLKLSAKQGCEWHAERLRHRAACRQLVQEAQAISARCLSTVVTRQDWEDKRGRVRSQLLSMLGLDPMPPRGDLQARQTGVLKRPACRMERIVFQPVPGLYATANFYLPDSHSEPLPCVVYLNGHWPSLDGAKTGFQDRYLWYPANGFALLVLDPLGFGEIPGVHPGLQRLNQWHWLSRGYTPAGVEVWNAMRALDWLETRPEIDPARIGVTGVSGGGVMTQYLAALDERVAVAAPSCSTYTIGHQAQQNLVCKQCDCTFYPNVSGLDFPEVLSLIAPRPLLILGGRKDPIFPPAGFREAYRKVRRVYEMLESGSGPASRVRLVESGEGHTDPPHFLDETHRWMCRWLRDHEGNAPASEREALPPVPPEQLRCTGAPPLAALNYHIQDRWIPAPIRALPDSPDEWRRRRNTLESVLREQVFGWFPSTGAPFRTRRRSSSGGYAGDCADFGEYEFDVERGVSVRACLLRPRTSATTVPLVVWIKNPGDQVVFPDLDFFFPLLRSHALVVVTPRFSDRRLSAVEQATIERTAGITGRSIAAMRVWDVLRTVEWAIRDCALAPSGVAVTGTGDAGIAGLYAAVIDPRIGHVVLDAPPVSHLDGFALPMVLRHTDLDEVAGLLAPRRLTLVSRRPDGFERTQSLFELENAAASFTRAPSLAEALLAPSPVFPL